MAVTSIPFTDWQVSFLGNENRFPNKGPHHVAVHEAEPDTGDILIRLLGVERPSKNSPLLPL